MDSLRPGGPPVVTMRELARSTAQVIHAARNEKRPTVVTLRGKPAVLLLPLDRWRIDLGSLAPDRIAMKTAVEHSEMAIALTKLEIAGLAAKSRGGYRRT